jgi:hypothetical protein
MPVATMFVNQSGQISIFLAHLAFWQGELLPSLGIRRLLTFHILIFSSETAWPN